MVTVLLFAHLKEAVGEDRIKIDAAGETIATIKGMLQQQYGVQGLDDVMVAVNEEYATTNATVQDEDVVAFIPPVSGG
ncbi:molybdopterin converting factor subunit 1 [Pontibacillus litoralis]|uniref:Molybdopterin synthase sulfur carrier subunit n=1 Tax=Pontibacillus litoralis JSM 072002 TaxID=1385512 RepID=A0A0A5G6R5_9BACI|nr:molybdopterin converting factor subunit 1 [Pontibacillus litoralis]KGX87739.1 molybdenum cofactor biosynthesis protein MoaD [Pontibacillus litoralis JSM 072002]